MNHKYYTYHCHTKYSDGDHSVKEMVNRAEKLGFSEIGIADHFCIKPNIDDISWQRKLTFLDAYVHDIREADDQSNISVKAGLEVDYFHDNPKQYLIDAIIDKYNIDYTIGSIHWLYGDSAYTLGYHLFWENLSQDEIDKTHKRYWKLIKNLIKSNRFSFIGHLDLVKKCGFTPSYDITNDIDEVLNLLSQSTIPMEFNTSGLRTQCEEIFPSFEIMKKCGKLNIPILINDDAHATKDMGLNYDDAYKLAKKAGCYILEKLSTSAFSKKDKF